MQLVVIYLELVIPDSKSIFNLSENDFDEVVDLNLKRYNYAFSSFW